MLCRRLRQCSITRDRTFRVQTCLLLFACCRLIVGSATLIRLLLAVVFSAAKRTTQVLPLSIAGMRKEANSAVCTVSDTTSQIGISCDNRVERVLKLLDQRINPIVDVPIFANREKFLDRDNKKARFSVTILNLSTPSCYLIDAKASIGSTRFFMRLAKKTRSRSASSVQDASVSQSHHLAKTLQFPRTLTKLLESKRDFPFQVVAQFN